MFPLRVVGVIKYLRTHYFVKQIQSTKQKAFSHKYLLLTNVGISLTLSSIGDLIEQKYEIYVGELTEWEKKRTLHMAISGTGVGVICHYWYQFLDARMPGRTIDIVLKKVLLDQLICSPAYISVFFITLGILEQKTPKETWEEMKTKAWKLYAAEWVVWPIAQIINFYWLPLKYRVLYDNVISLGYDIFTSHVKHKNS